jgi:hypothetical protein
MCGQGCVRGPYWWYSHADWSANRDPSYLPEALGSLVVSDANGLRSVVAAGRGANGLDVLASALLVAVLNGDAGADPAPVVDEIATARAILAVCPPGNVAAWAAFMATGRCGDVDLAELNVVSRILRSYNAGRRTIPVCDGTDAAPCVWP